MGDYELYEVVKVTYPIQFREPDYITSIGYSEGEYDASELVKKLNDDNSKKDLCHYEYRVREIKFI